MAKKKNKFPQPSTTGGNTLGFPGSTTQTTNIGQYDQYKGTGKEPFSAFDGKKASSRWSPWQGAREVRVDARAHIWTSWPVSNGNSTGSGTPGSTGGNTTNTQTQTSTDGSSTSTPTSASNGPSFAADGTPIPAGTAANGAQNGGPPISFTGNPTDIIPNPNAGKNTGNPGGFTAIGTSPGHPGSGTSSGGGGADVAVKVLDITQDIMGGTLTRKRGATTRLTITITNEDSKYEGWFIPMDRIRLWLRRGDIEYVAFTGYISATPFYNLYPSQELTIECECLIGRFTRREWDPSYPPNVLYLSSGIPDFGAPGSANPNSTNGANGSTTQQGNDTGTPTTTPQNGGTGQGNQQAPTGAPAQNGTGASLPTGASISPSFDTNPAINPAANLGLPPNDAITSSSTITHPLLPTAANNGQSANASQPTKQDYLNELQSAIDNPPPGTDPQTLQNLLDTLSNPNAEEPGQGTSGDPYQSAYQQVNDTLGAPNGNQADPNNPAARQAIPQGGNNNTGLIKGVIWPDQTLAYLLTAPQLLDIDPSLIYIQKFPQVWMDIANTIDSLNTTCRVPWKELIKCQTPGANCESHGSSTSVPNVSGGFPGCDAGQQSIANWLAHAGQQAGLPPALLPALSLQEGQMSCQGQPDSNAGGPLFGITGGGAGFLPYSAEDGLQQVILPNLLALKSTYNCAPDDCGCISAWINDAQKAGAAPDGYQAACEQMLGTIGGGGGNGTQVSGKSVNPSSNSCGTGGTTKPMGPGGVDGGSLPQSPTTPGASPSTNSTGGTTPTTTNAPTGGQ